MQVQFLPDATTGAVNAALADTWDAVHITGHGAPDGRLLFENEFGVGHLIDARDLVRMFGKHLPRVVVLSLCYSGQNVPDALLKAGIGSVVAIRADVPIADRAATLFNQQFYSSLARGETVAEAFQRAQTRVALDGLVGDSHPPLGDEGKPEEPWSK